MKMSEVRIVSNFSLRKLIIDPVSMHSWISKKSERAVQNLEVRMELLVWGE